MENEEFSERPVAVQLGRAELLGPVQPFLSIDQEVTSVS